MKRRQFIRLFGSATASVPLVARAQRQPMKVVGLLASESPDLWADRVHAFREGLRERGHVEGQNVAVEYRWAEGRYERLPTLAAGLVQRGVHVIAAPVTQSALAAKAATTTIPIVFITGGDPVRLGLVASLERPGGNLTGVVNLNVGLARRRLELLHDLLPSVMTVALLVDPTNVNANSLIKEVQEAALPLHLQVRIVHAVSERDFNSAFANIAQVGAEALMIGTEGFLVSRSAQLASLTVRHRVPTIFQFREYVAAGGLMSYGGSTTGNFLQLGVYVGRILNGERPADLPVEQSTKLELVINLRTARALGVVVPQALLVQADEVIQ